MRGTAKRSWPSTWARGEPEDGVSRGPLLCSLLAAFAAASVAAQAPDFSGTWKLDRARSQIDAAAGLAGLGAAGAPPTLNVTQAENGTVIIGSEVNQGQARTYRLDGESSAPAAGGVTVPVRSRREGRVLVTEGPGLKEELSLSADGQMLTVTVATRTSAGGQTSTLVYRRTESADPCRTWPTPCVQ